MVVLRCWRHRLTYPYISTRSAPGSFARDNIEAGFEPALKRDLNIENGDSLVLPVAPQLAGYPSHCSHLERNAILAKLKGIYEKGVVETTLYEAIAAGRLRRARLIHACAWRYPYPHPGYLSPRRAYMQLDHALQEDRHRSAYQRPG